MKANIQQLAPYQPDTSQASIRLDANENAVDFSAAFMEDIFLGIDSLAFNRYPDTDSRKLRKAYADYCGVSEQMVIAGNGSDEIIRLLLECYIDKGEVIVYHDPTFAMYDITCQIVGGIGIKVPPLANFEVDVDDIIRAAQDYEAKVVFLCNPNNPTGGVICRSDIIKVIESVESIVVVDEAYFEFYGETVVDLVSQYDNLIVLRTMSKAFGLAAARVGFGIASQPIMELLTRVRAPYNLNSISQMLGRVYLENSNVILRTVEDTKVRRQALLDVLSTFDFIQVYPTRSNFIYMKTDRLEEIREVVREKIALRYFGDEFFRVSVGTHYENETLIELLRQVENNANSERE